MFDIRRGVETSKRVSAEQLGFLGTERVNYRPSGWRTVKTALARIPISPDDVFIDFGSGKGRVVLEAARHPFKRVIGVEVSEELHEVAKRNVARSRQRRLCPQIELVHADVLDYALPDDVTVAYFFNPFRGELFAHVAEQLAASVERNPRDLTVVYVNPQEEEALLRAGATLVERIGHTGSGDEALAHSIGIYSLRPS